MLTALSSAPFRSWIDCGSDDKDAWHPRDCEELSERISAHYGLPIDMSSKRGGLKAIANALNEGDVARAQIATVLLGIPDLPPLSKDARSRKRMLKLVCDLHWSGLLKWDSDEHPRWPAGTPMTMAGKRAENLHRRDKAATQARHLPRSLTRPIRKISHSQKPADNQHENIWQTLGSHLSHDAKSALAQIGQAEATESYNNLAIAAAERDAIAHTLRDYANYRAQLWLDSDGRPVEIPAIDIGNPVAGPAELMIRLTAHEPLTRPATNADWIDPLFNLAAAGARAPVPFRFAGPIAEAIDAADIATTSTNVAERMFATTEGVTVRGSRAIDRAASYETGVQKLYGDVPLSQRTFQTTSRWQRSKRRCRQYNHTG